MCRPTAVSSTTVCCSLRPSDGTATKHILHLRICTLALRLRLCSTSYRTEHGEANLYSLSHMAPQEVRNAIPSSQQSEIKSSTVERRSSMLAGTWNNGEVDRQA